MASWWVPSRIHATVNRAFVVQQLVPEEIERLDHPVAFGGGDLTERTYWESIRDQAKRIFMILVDLGIPDQIFGIVDDGWNDGELPLSFEDVERLQLTAVKDDRVDRKFYQRQFHYLLKAIEKGDHVVYGDLDVVPIDVIDRSPAITGKASQVDRVRLPNVPELVLCRRRFPIGNGPACITEQGFLDSIASVRSSQNDHIVSYWASYIHQGVGYLLISPFADFNLKSFLSTTPASYKNLAKTQRRELILNWILCLVDTLCFLHSQNRPHCYIKPSTILFNNQNHIFFADSARLTPDSWTGRTDKSSFDREWYDYAAPEQWFRPTGPASPPSRRYMDAAMANDANFNIPRNFDAAGSPTAMLNTPTPQLNPQYADIFSLGCVILEMLSFLVKKSTSKFAAHRSAKHKSAGRGGAVLDTSFHKNLGQVESWMASLAKDASKKVTDSEGGHVFRGLTPMLHVVTGMLSVNPQDRPSAVDVQQRIYQILTDTCGIHEPHCVHQYSADLQYALSRMRISGNNTGLDTGARMRPANMNFSNTPRAFHHGRSNSSSGFSQRSEASSGSVASNEREGEGSHSSARGIPVPIPQQVRTQTTWPAHQPRYMSPPGNPTFYTTAP
ncbi:kinase-like domain-containing protein [Stachybotrys elegans]|uniref:Kinase-like domain-containing protein n=1 Tax=Stachybotrys elegans TaxID=80388 RepID=A0A8K0SUH4_9HYPO|nr:kinase-like domain-containing protein [Stachybotrys elegans]